MQPNQSNRYQVKGNSGEQQSGYSSKNPIQNGQNQDTIPDFDLNLVLKQLVYKLQKLYVALKYQFYKLTSGVFDGLALPWFKIGLGALALFVVTQKDIQFSIDMKAPFADESSEAAYSQQTTNTSELSFAHSVAMKRPGANATRSVINVEDLNTNKVKAYIKRFSKVATAEMEKYGIPASVKMAQGILESQAGGHPASAQENNHFGAPLAGRTYNSAWENWRTHSLLMKDQYAALFDNGTSYRKWAKALKATNYSRDKKYDQKLIKVIETYQLYLLDEV